MADQYKGYEIKVFWSEIEKGYVFCVFSMDGEGIMESEPYFYEENALIGARETIDRLIEVKKEGVYNMDYLTFTTVHTMVILSLCGLVYLCRQLFILIQWIVKGVWKDLKEE